MDDLLKMDAKDIPNRGALIQLTLGADSTNKPESTKYTKFRNKRLKPNLTVISEGNVASEDIFVTNNRRSGENRSRRSSPSNLEGSKILGKLLKIPPYRWDFMLASTEGKLRSYVRAWVRGWGFSCTNEQVHVGGCASAPVCAMAPSIQQLFVFSGVITHQHFCLLLTKTMCSQYNFLGEAIAKQS